MAVPLWIPWVTVAVLGLILLGIAVAYCYVRRRKRGYGMVREYEMTRRVNPTRSGYSPAYPPPAFGRRR